MATTTGTNAGSVQLTTVQTTSSTQVEMMTVGDTAYPYMRAKTVTFTVSGLKPNTQYYPFFNGAYVGNYCSLASPPTFTNGIVNAADQALKTNALGAMVGNFYLPAQTFVSGSHIFKLVDTVKLVDGVTVPDPLYGVVEAIYEANGVLKRMSTSIQQDLKTNIDIAQPPPQVVTVNVPTPAPPPPPTITPAAAVTPVATPVNPTPPTNITPPPPVTCESWWFEYEMIGGGGGDGSGAGIHAGSAGFAGENTTVFQGASNWIIPSNSATPPSIDPTIAKYVGTQQKTAQALIDNPTGPVKTDKAGNRILADAAHNPTLDAFNAAVAAGGTVSNIYVSNQSRATLAGKSVSYYEHTFTPLASSARSLAAASAGYGGVRIYKMEWVGPTVNNVATDLPSLTNFVPSGLNIFSDSSSKGGQQLAKVTFKIRTPWTKRGTAVCPVNGKYGFQETKAFPSLAAWHDPLAQSFTIDAAKYPDGMFVTAIGVYFKTVDQSTPVKLEIREMTNGLPGSRILPRATSILQGFMCMGTPNASIATKFSFDSPIYLKPATDYCFVVTSTSLGYNAWTSRVGEVDAKDGKVIETQPFLGTLFKSENNVTWIPDSYEDLKFEIYKADFDTTKTGSLIFRPQYDAVTDNYTSTAVTLPLSYITTTKGSATIKVKVPMHSLSTGNKVYITGIAPTDPETLGYNGIPAACLTGERTITVLDVDTISFTAVDSAGNSASAKVTGYIQVQEVPNLIHAVAATMPPSVASTAMISVPFKDPSIIAPATLNGASATDLTQPVAPTLVSSSNFTIYTNIPFNEAMIDYVGSEFTDTEIVETVYATTAQSTAGTEDPYSIPSSIELPERKDFHSFDVPHMIASPRNENLYAGTQGTNKSFAAHLELKSTNKDVSPIVDTDGMGVTIRSYKIDNQNSSLALPLSLGGEIDAIKADLSSNAIDLTTAENRMNSSTYNSEIIAGKGNASAKYKSAVNQLGTPFNDLTVYVTGNCPSPAIIDCYIRVSSDADTHADHNWVWAPIDGVFNTAFTNSPSKSTLNEWEFKCTAAHPAASGTGYFTVFDVKLVMRTTNNSIVPKIYGVRAIANVV